jgi:hypothetical protein
MTLVINLKYKIMTFIPLWIIYASILFHFLIQLLAIYFLFKKETKMSKFLWTLAILFIPFLCVIYLLMSILNRKKINVA